MSKDYTQQDITEILHHMGEHGLPENAVAPPIFQSSIFCFDSFEAFQEALKNESEHYIYSRGNNPTVNLCEDKIAALEHTERAKHLRFICPAFFFRRRKAKGYVFLPIILNNCLYFCEIIKEMTIC